MKTKRPEPKKPPQQKPRPKSPRRGPGSSVVAEARPDEARRKAPSRRSPSNDSESGTAAEATTTPSSPPSSPPSRTATQRDEREPGPSPTVVAQIRELEAQLDRLIDEASSRRDLSALAGPDDDDSNVEDTRETLPRDVERFARDDRTRPGLEADSEWKRVALEALEHARPDTRTDATATTSRPSSPARPSTTDRSSASCLGQGEATVFDTARELLSSDFYLRKWGRLAMRGRSEEVDDFGFDPIYEQKARTVLEFLYTRYFRVETSGIDRVPSRGRCLLVANHSGTLPLDGVMLKTAVKLEHSAPRDVRWLTEDFIYHMPYLGSMMNRLGAVRACQENAERLLSKEQLVAVFPEGVKGIGKLFSERYRLQRFGRGGFIKLCLRTHTPIVPVAIIGAEETNPLLFRIEYLSKALGVPYVPVTPTFPALGPLGLLPAPTKWQIHFGEPIDFGGYGLEAADDELLVGKLAERVRATIQGMLDRAVGTRKSIFFG